MSSPSHSCDGCGAVLAAKDDLSWESGAGGRSWSCRYCGTSVPGIVAEKLSHRRDGSPTDRRS